MLPDGEKFCGQSLPILLKKYAAKVQGNLIIYVDNMFGVFSLFEVMELYKYLPENAYSIIGEKVKIL